MEVEEVAHVTSKKKNEKNESPGEGSSKTESKKADKKADGEDPKPRIVLTFRSEKAGAKTSTMKIVPTEEKHEEISPRRSSRTRTTKWDSDDDGEQSISPRKDKNQQHTSENDDTSDSSHTPLKRSTRRRSKDFDNVIANAIARKEKSYNETLAPSRPSRRIKPTAKVLANEEMRFGLESQHNARVGAQTEKSPEGGVKTRRSVRGQPVIQEEPQVGKKDVKNKVVEAKEEQNQNEVMKLKHLCELGLKAIDHEESQDGEDEKSGEEAIEVDDETAEDEEIDDDSEVISKLLEADDQSFSDSDEEFLCSGENRLESKARRSNRLAKLANKRYSPFKNDSGRSSPTHIEDDQGVPLRRSSRKRVRYSESPTTAEMIGYEAPDGDDFIQSEAASGAETTESADFPSYSVILAACCCEDTSNLYAAPSELTEPVFCQAIEMVDEVRVGCSHRAAREQDGTYSPMVRAGRRAPYMLACKLHNAQMRKHMCCPACGLFCSQGYFFQCSLGHLFHLECSVPYNDSKAKPGCPHCGVRRYQFRPFNEKCWKVKVNMHCSNKRIFMPEQREQCTPAYLGFSTLKPQFDAGPVIPEDLLPSTPIDLKRLCEKPDLEEDPTDAAELLCEAILAGEDVESLIPKIVSGAGLDIPLPSLCGGTVVHAAAKRGHLSAIHLLHTAGADLNSMAACKTPLMVAVLALLDRSDQKSPKKSKMDKHKESDSQKDAEKESEGEDKDDQKSVAESRPDEAELLKVIRYLIAAGCDVNIPGPDGMTALHMAAQHGGTEVCRIILEAGAVDPRDQGGWTPLVWAAENQHTDTVRLLLSYGADGAATDGEGNSVIHWCALAGAGPALRLLLDRAPATAHALNAHTDTPLHVAARQGHYACVILLLARGARTDVQNSAGEMPLDVCERDGPCYNAISLNMQMTIAVSEKLTLRRLLSSDISRGREEIPVPCVNEIDDTPLPANFVYVTAHVMPRNIPIDNTIETLQGCNCSDDCTSSSCACSTLSVRRWWGAGGGAGGRLAPPFPYHDPPMLFDCNATCGCHAKKCANSVITRLCSKGSIFIRATVFRVGRSRGWGLRAQSRVLRGTPVATYVGELLTMEDADKRSADQYMFALDVKPDLLEQCSDKTQLCVDAAQYGGAGRFINHSCRPNLAPVRVFTHSRDLRLPTVTLFAATDIAAGEELTFDYGDKFWSVKSKWMRCECGASDCRYPTKSDEMET